VEEILVVAVLNLVVVEILADAMNLVVVESLAAAMLN